MKKEYLFTSLRLGFRNWTAADSASFTAMNTHPAVMQYFPSLMSSTDSLALMERLQSQYEEKGYTYFAVETLADGQWIGMIGFSYQIYESPFTPAVDIGWRLMPFAWGNGYAREGASRCLDFASETLGLSHIISVCPTVNLPSQKVMQSIGMKVTGTFKHPALKEYPALENCVCYTWRKPKLD